MRAALSLASLKPQAPKFPTTRSEVFDRLVGQASVVALALKDWGCNKEKEMATAGHWLCEREGRSGTYRSIRQDRYDFDRLRHSGSLVPRCDLMHLR
jgi:hypothetical protein